MVDIPDQIICYVVLPYLIDDKSLQGYLDLVPEDKRLMYLEGIAHTFLGRAVDSTVAKYFIDISSSDYSNNTKLVSASKNGHLSVVQYLVEAKTDIHASDDLALRWAADKGHVDVVQYLVEAKADIHAANDYALRWAADRGHLAVVQYLVEAKADIHASDDLALRWATDNGHLTVVQYLVEAKANIHAVLI